MEIQGKFYSLPVGIVYRTGKKSVSILDLFQNIFYALIRNY